MRGGSAHMWHDRMYQGHALVATLVAKQLLTKSYIYTSCIVVVTHN